MTLEQLRIFLVVAEELHFTRAARRLGLTQPAVSGAIAALENQHQIHLFHRVGRSVSLTEAGQLLAKEGRQIVQRVADVEQHLSDLSGLKSGDLHIMASQTAGTYWLPSRLHDFAERYPGVSLSVSVGNTTQVIAAVLAGTVDLGVVEGTADDPHLARLICAQDRLVVVVGRGHPWFGRESVTAEDLQREHWIMREKGSGTRDLVECSLRAFGVDVERLRTVLTLPNGESIRNAIAGGHGVTLLSWLVVEQDVERGRLHVIPIPAAVRDFTVIRHLERYEGAAAHAFVDMVRREQGPIVAAEQV